ncbi:hypothetical protein [Oceanivirga salmonicida]|uniref:hypothetical protein n=1 Tax=Oceanivirga salmonicida TaxID=1769291 RepID=UPI00082E241F|nr:hypothetical protein [Oceanivirga salmonicida]
MKKTINIFYMLLIITCISNTSVVIIDRYNIFEIVYNIEERTIKKIAEIRKIKTKFFASFLCIQKYLYNLVKEYINFYDYNKINIMISLE